MNSDRYGVYKNINTMTGSGSSPGQTGTAEGDIDAIASQVAAIALTCQAMWEIMRDNDINLSDDLILKKMEEIDLRDGKRDGKISTTIFECASCGRKVSSSKSNCLYCGTAISHNHLFNR